MCKQPGLSHWGLSNSPHISRHCSSNINVSLKTLNKIGQDKNCRIAQVCKNGNSFINFHHPHSHFQTARQFSGGLQVCHYSHPSIMKILDGSRSLTCSSRFNVYICERQAVVVEKNLNIQYTTLIYSHKLYFSLTF